MKLEEAYQILQVLPEELNSLQTYFGFRHTSINVLSNLTPETYENLTNSGWLLAETEEDLKKDIADFVNLYSVMYKTSKDKEVPANLIRGTSNNAVNAIGTSIPQLISTSTDITIAKTFCEYGDDALIHFSVAPGVPFLDAEMYRDENRKNEHEIILSPFCTVTKKELYSNYQGYTHYRIGIEKTFLEEKSSDDLVSLMEDVSTSFTQNLKNMVEYNHLKNHLEYLDVQYERFKEDPDDRKFILKQKSETYDKLNSLFVTIHNFQGKLQSLLQGLCRQKEIEIDKANEFIEETKRKQIEDEENRRKEEAERVEALQKETSRKKMMSELSNKLSAGPMNIATLETSVLKTYQSMLSTEMDFKKVAQKLGVDFSNLISHTNVGQEVSQIQENGETFLAKLNGISIDDNISLEDVSQMSTDFLPLLDGVCYGTEIAKSFPEIAELYAKQSDTALKRSLFFKVQSTLQNAKVQKLLQEKESISSEEIGFFGRLTGKELLRSEKLKNINLKIKLAQLPPGEQERYSVRDMLADIYACGKTDLDGHFTPEMTALYEAIISVYQDAKTGKFSEEYISRLANQKIVAEQQHNLPTVSHKGLGSFARTKTQSKAFQLANEELQKKLNHSTNSRNRLVSRPETSDAISLFEQRLKGIINHTREQEKRKDKSDIEQTFDLWGEKS